MVADSSFDNQVRWEPTVQVWPTTSAVDPGSLVAGRDLVVDCVPSHGGVATPGAILDDHLNLDDRAAIDAEARRQALSWHRVRASSTSIDGIELADVWEAELLADVFLPLARAVIGLERVLVRNSIRRVELRGFDEGLFRCLDEVLEPRGVAVAEMVRRDPALSAQGGPANASADGRRRRAITGLLASLGVPSWPRGNALFLPYWHLRPVIARLEEGHSVVPFFDIRRPPAGARRDQVRLLWRGGWIGMPSRRARRRSRSAVNRVLSDLVTRDRIPPLDAVVDARAVSLLAERAGDTAAEFGTVARALRRGPTRLLVLPFDSPPDTRVWLLAARAAGVPTLVVQHGFHAEPNDPDKTRADVVAVWSRHDADELDGRRNGGEVVVCGNAGISAPPARQEPKAGPVLVLVEYASRLSTAIPQRIRFEHVRAALDALAVASPEAEVVIRPHPFDDNPAAYEALARTGPHGRVRVDTSSAINALIADASVCVGAVSTATLEAALAGVPTVFLNVARTERMWPFDGRSGLPIARTATELARWLEGRSDENYSAAAVAAEALGVRDDALPCTVELIERLVRRAGR